MSYSNFGPVINNSANPTLQIAVGSASFDTLLQQKGAVFNGTTDDSSAIQSAIDTYTNDKRGKITFPPGCSTKINSGLNIKSGLCAIDFNGAILDASGMTSGYGMSIIPNGLSPYSRYAKASPISNFMLIGPASEANPTDGIFEGRLSGSGEVSGQTLENFLVYGFRDGMYIGDQVYVNTVVNGNIESCYRNGLNYVGTTNAGENFNWHGGRIANCSNAAVGAIGINMPAGGNNELHLFGVSLDYNNINGSFFSGRIKIFGGNLENNNNASPMFIVDATTGGSWVELVLASDLSWTEPSSERPVIIQVTGDNAFVDISKNHFYGYNLIAELVHIVSGRPKINYKGAHVLATGIAGSQPAICYGASEVYQGQNAGTPVTTPWVAGSGNVALTVGTGLGVSAANSIHMVWTGTASADAYYDVPISAGQALHVQAYVNVTTAPASTTVFFRIRWVDKAGNNLLTENINRSGGAGSWTATTGAFEKISTRKCAPIGAAFARIDFWNTNTAAIIDVDQVNAWVL